MKLPVYCAITSLPMPISSGLCVNTHLLWLIFTPVSLSVCVTFAVSVSPAITLVLLGSIVAFAGAVSSLTVISCGLLACSPSVILTYTVWPFCMPSIVPPVTGVQLPSSVPPIWYSIVTSGSVVFTVTFAVHLVAIVAVLSKLYHLAMDLVLGPGLLYLFPRLS